VDNATIVNTQFGDARARLARHTIKMIVDNNR